MAKLRNDTGSVLVSHEFGRAFPPGEFELDGYDPKVHGVIPGCVWLDAPKETAAAKDDGEKSSATRGKAADKDKEAGE